MGFQKWAAGNKLPLAITLVATVVVAGGAGLALTKPPPLSSFREQACSLPTEWLQRIQRGYFRERSGQISLLPRYPAYIGTAEGGWSHSGPWPYLQDVPLVFYGPDVIEPHGDVDRPVTIADVAPTLTGLLRGFFRTDDGERLDEVVRFNAELVARETPRLIVVVVWDGGGWNVLERWPEAWPNLKRLMVEGVSYTEATVGSSPSVTPSVHTTLGTGVFPWTHGITGIPIRDEDGKVVDSFFKGESSRFIEVPAFAERWDEQVDNRALVGMVGYEPWHLGMIGRGSEDPTGDRDHAVWLDTETNEWISSEHYRLPEVFEEQVGLNDDLAQLDSRDGEVDSAWGSHRILDDRSRIEETPAFITYHGRVMRDLIKSEGYGQDVTTDLLFTNFKQIDRVGHYFNMASIEVRKSIAQTDRQLGALVSSLDRSVGEGEWALVVTADHGQQPDAEVVDGYGIDPREVKRDIDDEFGDITRAVWPTEVFLEEDAMQREGVTVEDVALYLGDYRLADNTQRPDMLFTGAGRFESRDRLFSMAIPSRLLPGLTCGAGGASSAGR